MEYESERRFEAKAIAGASFTIARMSFGRRIELTRRSWGLAGKTEVLESGSEPREKLEAALLASEIDRVYLSWGLLKIDGLTVDGQAATPELLIAAGPEELSREILAAIKSECGLTDEERKN